MEMNSTDRIKRQNVLIRKNFPVNNWIKITQTTDFSFPIKYESFSSDKMMSYRHV